jgi:nitrogen fixation protein NifU and related proteins
MSNSRGLYQDVILDHGKRPRNFGQLEEDCARACGHNPLCGDQLTIYLKVENDLVSNVRFEGVGCAIFTASSSLLTEVLRGKSVAEVRHLIDHFITMVTTPVGEVPEIPPELGKLAVFSGVREFPMRVKCATLAWHTFLSALNEGEVEVSTE